MAKEQQPPPVVLDYQSPLEGQSPERQPPRQRTAAGCGGTIGIALSAIAVLGVVFTDDDQYVLPFRLAFPFVNLTLWVFGNAYVALFALAAQFPVYGLILGEAAARGRLLRAAVWVGAVHAAAAALCVALQS